MGVALIGHQNAHTASCCVIGLAGRLCEAAAVTLLSEPAAEVAGI